MPHKVYHGRTGIVWNITKRAVGVEVNKQVTAFCPLFLVHSSNALRQRGSCSYVLSLSPSWNHICGSALQSSHSAPRRTSLVVGCLKAGERQTLHLSDDADSSLFCIASSYDKPTLPALWPTEALRCCQTPYLTSSKPKCPTVVENQSAGCNEVKTIAPCPTSHSVCTASRRLQLASKSVRW